MCICCTWLKFVFISEYSPLKSGVEFYMASSVKLDKLCCVNLLVVLKTLCASCHCLLNVCTKVVGKTCSFPPFSVHYSDQELTNSFVSGLKYLGIGLKRDQLLSLFLSLLRLFEHSYLCVASNKTSLSCLL